MSEQMSELLPLVKFIEEHPEVDVVGYLRKILNWVRECPVKHADSPGLCSMVLSGVMLVFLVGCLSS